MNKFISLLYSLLVGAAVVTFVGLGVYAFYPSPDFDQDCYELARDSQPKLERSFEVDPYYDSDEYRDCQDSRDTERQDHAQNVTIVSLVATIVLTAAIVKVPIGVSEIKDGLLLGAVMTAIYTIVWAGIAEHRVLLFFSGVLFLATAITTGYLKFKVDKI
jgi:hypothetical protein